MSHFNVDTFLISVFGLIGTIISAYVSIRLAEIQSGVKDVHKIVNSERERMLKLIEELKREVMDKEENRP